MDPFERFDAWRETQKPIERAFIAFGLFICALLTIMWATVLL